MPSPKPSPSPPLPEYLTQYNLTQECRNLIASLPIEKAWIANHFHKYEGFWHSTRHLYGVLNFQRHFEAQEDDVLLVTTPKSGTTWLKALVFSLMNREKYPSFQMHPLLANNPHVLVPFLDLNLYAGDQTPDLTGMPSPRLFATHLPYVSLPESVKDSSCRIVYLCRNPKDVFVSLWHFTNKLRVKQEGNNSMEELFDMFCRGVSLCGPFWDHVLGYWKKSLEDPKRVLFLRYEEMREEPLVQLKKLADFLDRPFSTEEETKGVVEEILKLCSFDNLRNLEINQTGKLPSGEELSAFFRRGEVGDWKNYLTAEMGERMDKITQEKWHGFGLKF